MKKILFLLLLTILNACDSAEDAGNQSNATDGKGGSMATFILKYSHLYTVDHTNLNVFNISNPENPVKVNSVNVGFNIETLFSMDKYLFIGSRNGMFIYSIEANAEAPVKLAQASHFTACDPVVANSTAAFVTIHTNTSCNPTANANRLLAYNITDITKPMLMAQRSLQEPKGLALYKNYLILCDKDDLLFFNVSDIKDIRLEHAIPNTPAVDLIVQDDRIMAFTKSHLVQFEIDPQDIKQTKQISSYTL